MTNKPTKPVVPASAVVDESVASIQVESNDVVATSGIQISTNDSVGFAAAPAPESVVDDSHPQGIVIETFVGIQTGVNWAKPESAA